MNKFPLLIILVFTLSACVHNVSTKDVDVEIRNAYLNKLNKSNLQINLASADKLNHQATALGLGCSAHKYDLDLKNDLIEALNLVDKDNEINNTDKFDISVTPDWARSNFKCVIDGFATGRCQSLVEISGTINYASGRNKPFKISKSVTKETSACGGALTSLQEASLEAISDLASIVKK